MLVILSLAIPAFACAGPSAIQRAGPVPAANPVRTEGIWIWGPGETKSLNERRYFRGIVAFPAPPRVALLRISADTRYSLWINGSFVADGQVRGGSARFPAGGPGAFPSDRHEVGRFLKPGPNSIAVLVHHAGGNFWMNSSDQGGLFVQVDWLEGGHRRSFISSEEWKTIEAFEWERNAPVIGGGAGYFEVYDARKAMPVEWTSTWFDDSEWDFAEPAIPPSFPSPSFSSRPREENRIRPEKMVRHAVIIDTPEGESMEPSKSAFFFNNPTDFTVKPGAGGESPFVVYDFGRIIAASPRLETEGGEGAMVEISYSEEAGAGAGIFRDPDQCDRYICGSGSQTWGPLGVRGFRFVRMKFRNLPAPLKFRFWAVGDRVPAVDDGSFHCSDRRLNAIWKACVRTLDLCTFDVLVDSPTHQGLSAPDVLATASASYVLRTERDLARRSLRLVGDTRDDDGYVTGVYPQVPRERADENGLLWIIALADYYNWSGDSAFISEIIPDIKFALSWYESRASTAGLLEYSPSRIWIDDDDRRAGNVMKKDCDGASSALNSLYAGALEAASRLADSAGKTEYSGDWRAKAAAARKAMNDKLWNPGENCFYDCVSHDIPAGNLSQQSNALAALYAGVPADRIGNLLSLIVRKGDEDHAEWAQIGTPYFERYLLEALADNGMTTEAVRILRRKWGAMLAEKSASFGEKWTPFSGRSMCQGRSAHPAYFLVTRVLGVTPAVPGMSRVRVAPQMGGLEYASGRIPTPFGILEAGWKRRGDGISVELVCPPGVGATIELPTAGITRPVLRIGGRRVWKEGQAAPEGVVVEKSLVKVEVAPGKRAEVELY